MKRCPVCNEIVPRGHGYKTNQKYCSNKCYLEKPPKFLYIEQEIKNYSTTNKTLLADLLGVTRQTLYRYLERVAI